MTEQIMTEIDIPKGKGICCHPQSDDFETEYFCTFGTERCNPMTNEMIVGPDVENYIGSDPIKQEKYRDDIYKLRNRNTFEHVKFSNPKSTKMGSTWIVVEPSKTKCTVENSTRRIESDDYDDYEVDVRRLSC